MRVSLLLAAVLGLACTMPYPIVADAFSGGFCTQGDDKCGSTYEDNDCPDAEGKTCPDGNNYNECNPEDAEDKTCDWDGSTEKCDVAGCTKHRHCNCG